jgi:zinc transport system substrate-binding protein
MRQKDRKAFVLIFVFSAVILLPVLSCEEKNSRQEKIGVVVSVLPLADFVEHIGKDRIEVTVMVPPGASPHSYEPRPDQLKQVSRAKMFVKAGSGVEFELAWMDKIGQINRDMMVLSGSEGIELIEGDPHVWLSPLAAKTMAENICRGLVKLDPGNSKYYRANLNEYSQELEETDRYIRQELAGIRIRSFISYHPAWSYFARDYDLEQIPIERGGKEPTAEGIREVLEKAKKSGARVVFVLPQLATKGAETVAREIGAYIEPLDPLPEDYISDMRRAAERLAQAMR